MERIDFQDLKELEIMNRVCNTCGIEKPLTLQFFYKHPKKECLRNRCKDCWKPHYKKMHNKMHNNFKDRYPAPEKGIYGLIENNMLVYIGESKRMSRRLYDHFNCHTAPNTPNLSLIHI